MSRAKVVRPQRQSAGTLVPGENEFFAELPPTVRDVLLARAVRRTFARGEVLWTVGADASSICVVVSGRVRVLSALDRRPHVLHTENAGGTLGEIPFFDGGTYPATAIAAEETECLVLGRDAVRAAIKADPQVAWVLLARVARRVRELVGRIERYASHGVASRLAAYLIDRADRVEGAGEFTLGMTQEQLAQELGTVREVLVRALRSLRTAGAIRGAGRGRFVVSNRLALERVRQGETGSAT